MAAFFLFEVNRIISSDYAHEVFLSRQPTPAASHPFRYPQILRFCRYFIWLHIRFSWFIYPFLHGKISFSRTLSRFLGKIKLNALRLRFCAVRGWKGRVVFKQVNSIKITLTVTNPEGTRFIWFKFASRFSSPLGIFGIRCHNKRLRNLILRFPSRRAVISISTSTSSWPPCVLHSRNAF